MSLPWRTAASLLTVAAFIVAGCAQSPRGSTQTGELVGAATGAVVGGVIAGQAVDGAGERVAIGAGSAVGAIVGQRIGRDLSRGSRQRAARTTQRALENNRTGEAAAWDNPDKPESGTVTPKRTYRRPDGQPCREFQQTVVIGGETKQAYGTACRQPDGSWKIVQRR